MPLLGVNNRQPLLNISKILVYIYTTDKSFNQFEIGYIINPTLHVNKVFIENIRSVIGKKDTFVIAVIMFYYSLKINKSV